MYRPCFHFCETLAHFQYRQSHHNRCKQKRLFEFSRYLRHRCVWFIEFRMTFWVNSGQRLNVKWKKNKLHVWTKTSHLTRLHDETKPQAHLSLHPLRCVIQCTYIRWNQQINIYLHLTITAEHFSQKKVKDQKSFLNSQGLWFMKLLYSYLNLYVIVRKVWLKLGWCCRSEFKLGFERQQSGSSGL